MADMMGKLCDAMLRHEAGDAEKVNHLLKVYGYARAIGQLEGLDAETQTILETAALVHDIGIKPSMEKYGNCDGPNQEKEGAPLAEALLESLGTGPHLAQRVGFLVGHHHTYTGIDGPDWQILVEADFLVNIHEGKMAQPQIESVRRNIFKTGAGIRFLEALFMAGGA